MTITTVSCNQFAGIRDCRITLKEGLNIIHGNNESGKSTLVNLISRTLFQDAKLDRRSDKEFFERWFPSTKRGSALTADFVDGKLTLETDKGTYTLSKEWGADPRCVLSTPDGMIRDNAAVNAALKEVLVYGEGVYTEMLLSSQKNTDTALQTILVASKTTDAKRELADAVLQAFAESDGIPTDAIERAIHAKIDALVGKHWDVERGAPARKAGRWSNGLGEILKAYYALEDANLIVDTIARLEQDADRTSAAFADTDRAAEAARDAYERFHTVAAALTLQNERRKTITRLETELAKITAVLSRWPSLLRSVDEAAALQREANARQLLDMYTEAKRLTDRLHTIRQTVSNTPAPTDEDVTLVKSLLRETAAMDNALCGMNLTAAVTMLNDHRMTVTSLRTGEAIDVSDTVTLTEAVRITVDGVMTMDLAPTDVDVAHIESQLAHMKATVKTVLNTYGAASAEELETMAAERKRLLDDDAKTSDALARLLNDLPFEALEAQVNAIDNTPRDKDTVAAAMTALCGTTDVSRYLIAGETTLDAYETEYGSIDALKATAFDLQTELNKATAAVADTADVPKEFLGLADPEAHLQRLQADWKYRQQRREEALKEKAAAAGRLESYKSTLSDDPVDTAEKAAQAFAEQQDLLAHWQHIAAVFAAQKEQLRDNPLEDLAARFARNLAVISDGRVISEFPDADKMNIRIYSADRPVDYVKLSEGTKETVSLAFRLAVLDHLFPDGGGVAVLDDPFANMDADRTAQAAALITEFAARHQVIFLTCKAEYTRLLDGHRIDVALC